MKKSTMMKKIGKFEEALDFLGSAKSCHTFPYIKIHVHILRR